MELEFETIESISAETFREQVEKDRHPVFDVRKPGEFESEHLPAGKSTPLDFLNDHLAEFPKEGKFYIHCAGGYRSVIAASILKSRGIHNMVDVAGGFGAIRKTGMETSNEVVCASTLKNT